MQLKGIILSRCLSACVFESQKMWKSHFSGKPTLLLHIPKTQKFVSDQMYLTNFLACKKIFIHKLFCIFIDGDNSYDRYISFASCRTINAFSKTIKTKNIVLISDFPCDQCCNHNTVNVLHLSLFPQCKDVVGMIQDIITFTNWTKTTVFFKDLSGTIVKKLLPFKII